MYYCWDAAEIWHNFWKKKDQGLETRVASTVRTVSWSLSFQPMIAPHILVWNGEICLAAKHILKSQQGHVRGRLDGYLLPQQQLDKRINISFIASSLMKDCSFVMGLLICCFLAFSFKHKTWDMCVCAQLNASQSYKPTSLLSLGLANWFTVLL